MVELQLNTSDWQAYHKDHYISVRVGEVQKLAKLSASRSYKFPAAAVNARKYGKVEIFQRVGTAIVCVDPELAKGRNEVEVDLGTGSKISFEAQVCEPGGQAAKGPSQPANAKAGAGSPSSVSSKAAAYLEQHHLEVRLSDAMQAVLRERPEDPATFLANMLMKNANVVAKLPKAKPAEAAGKAPAGVQAAQGRPAAPCKPRPADMKAFGSYYVQNFEGGQMPGLYAKFPAAARPPPMPTTGEQRAPAFLPSMGSFGGCTARHGGTIPFKVRAVTSVPAAAAPAPAKAQPFGQLASVGTWLMCLPARSQESQAAPAPAKTQPFGQLASVGTWLMCRPARSQEAAASPAPVAEAAAVSAAEEGAPAPALPEEAQDPGFLMMNVSALGPGFWSTGMAPGLMF